MSRRWWCVPCMVTGLGMLFVAFGAMASGGDLSTGPIGWRDVGVTACGMVLLLFGFLGTRLYSRIDRLEEEADDHLDKQEARQLIGDLIAPLDERSRHIQDAVSAVHRRLDQLAVPHARAGHP